MAESSTLEIPAEDEVKASVLNRIEHLYYEMHWLRNRGAFRRTIEALHSTIEKCDLAAPAKKKILSQIQPLLRDVDKFDEYVVLVDRIIEAGKAKRKL